MSTDIAQMCGQWRAQCSVLFGRARATIPAPQSARGGTLLTRSAHAHLERLAQLLTPETVAEQLPRPNFLAGELQDASDPSTPLPYAARLARAAF